MRNVMPKFQNFRWNGLKYTIQINRYILKKNGKGAITQQKITFFEKFKKGFLNRYITNIIYEFQNSTVIN